MGLSDWLWVVGAFLLFDMLLGAVTIWFINWYGERDLARIRARFESQQDKDKESQLPGRQE